MLLVVDKPFVLFFCFSLFFVFFFFFPWYSRLFVRVVDEEVGLRATERERRNERKKSGINLKIKSGRFGTNWARCSPAGKRAIRGRV